MSPAREPPVVERRRRHPARNAFTPRSPSANPRGDVGPGAWQATEFRARGSGTAAARQRHPRWVRSPAVRGAGSRGAARRAGGGPGGSPPRFGVAPASRDARRLGVLLWSAGPVPVDRSGASAPRSRRTPRDRRPVHRADHDSSPRTAGQAGLCVRASIGSVRKLAGRSPTGNRRPVRGSGASPSMHSHHPGADAGWYVAPDPPRAAADATMIAHMLRSAPSAPW